MSRGMASMATVCMAQAMDSQLASAWTWVVLHLVNVWQTLPWLSLVPHPEMTFGLQCG